MNVALFLAKTNDSFWIDCQLFSSRLYFVELIELGFQESHPLISNFIFVLLCARAKEDKLRVMPKILRIRLFNMKSQNG